MTIGDWLIIIGVIVVAIAVGLYFLNRWATKKTNQQNDMIERSKQSASIFVIDKRRDRYTNVNLPKAATEKMPRLYKRLKLNFVSAKIGPQIITLMCDRRIFNYIQTKKTYKVELAGIYISSVKGMKTTAQMKKDAKAKKPEDKLSAKQPAKKK